MSIAGLIVIATAVLLMGIAFALAAARHDGPATGHIALAQVVAAVALIIPAYIGLGLLLQHELGWPERFGFSCRGRGCWISDIQHSPVLLNDPSAYRLGLFAYFWSMPALVIGAFVYAFVTKRGIFKKSDSE